MFLLKARVLHEEWPGNAADNHRRAAAGDRGVGFVELEQTGGQMDLCPSTIHRVHMVVALLTLQIQPENEQFNCDVFLNDSPFFTPTAVTCMGCFVGAQMVVDRWWTRCKRKYSKFTLSIVQKMN